MTSHRPLSTLLCLATCSLALACSPAPTPDPANPTPPAPDTSGQQAATDTPAGPIATISGTEHKVEAGEYEQGCLFVSADATATACVDHVLEMGYVKTTWSFLDLAKSSVTAQYAVYDGPSDGTTPKAEEVARVNEQLKLGGFRAIAKDKRTTAVKDMLQGEGPKRTLSHAGQSLAVTLPPVTSKPDSDAGRQSMACCEWQPRAAAEAGGHLAISLMISCNYTGDPSRKSDTCYIADYNDESMPHDSALLSVPLGQ